MSTPIPAAAQPHLSDLSQHLARFKDDIELGAGALELAGHLRRAAAACDAAADHLALAGLEARRAARAASGGGR